METTRTRRQALLTLIATVTFEVVAVLGLVALGRTPGARIDTADLGRWLDTTPLVDVAFALLRLVALALVAYLLATTVVYVAVRLTRTPTLVRAVAPLTLPTVRRVADRAIAGSLVTTTLVGGSPVAATALEAPPTATITVTESGALLPPGVRAPSTAPGETPSDTAAEPSDGPTVEPGRAVPIPTPRLTEPATGTPPSQASAPDRPVPPIPTPRPTAPSADPDAPAASLDEAGDLRVPGIPVPRPAPAATAPAAPRDAGPDHAAPDRPTPAAPVSPSAVAPSASTGPREWVAARGDSLWHIAEHVVAEALGVEVDAIADHQVADYWHELVSANRDRVASGDVDVVAIGERIVLPVSRGT